MAAFSADDVYVAVARSCAGPFPMVEDEETARLLAMATRPATDNLPPHLRCEATRVALETVFVMGLAAGIELGRGDA